MLDTACNFKLNFKKNYQLRPMDNPPVKPAFKGSIQLFPSELIMHDKLITALRNIKNYTVKEILNISKDDRMRLDCLSKFSIPEEDILLNNAITNIIKKYCDEFYGKENYTFISIGRSLATISKTLSLFGRKTEIIPLSGFSGQIDFFEADVGKVILRDLNAFFKKKHITKPDAVSSGKHFIFCDYAQTGATLRNVKNISLSIFLLKENSFLIFQLTTF